MSASFPALKPQAEMLRGRKWRIDRIVQPAFRRLWTLTLLCSVALGVSAYLAYASLMVGEVAGCGSGEVWNCGHVLHSRWSKFFNWPVSLLATGLYSVLLACLVSVHLSVPENRRRLAWSMITVGGVCAGLAAMWFMSLQAFAVGRLCVYCLIAHACGITFCAAVLWRRPLGTRTTARLASVSVLFVSLLIGGQLAAPPESFKIERFAEEPAAGGNAGGERSAAIVDQKRAVEVFEPF